MSYLDDTVFHSLEGIRATGAVAEHLGDAWKQWMGDAPDKVAVETQRTVYEPFEGATVMAEASVVTDDGEPGESVNLELYLRVYTDAAELERASKSACAEGCVSNAVPPFFTIPSFHAAVWTLPNGPGLSALPWAIDPSSLARLAGTEENSFIGGGEGPLPRLVRYAPPNMAEFAYQTGRDARLVLKILDPVEAGIAHANYCLIEAAGERGDFGFRVPDLIVADPSRGAIVLREPRGRVFTSYMQQPFREPFERLGRALVSLHRASIRPTTVLRTETVVDSALKAAQRVVRVLPELATAMESIVERILTGVSASEIDRVVPIHGHLDGDSIFVDGATVGICDWDNLMCGHPYYDVAAVCAHTIDQSLAVGAPTGVPRACVRALVESYGAQRGSAVARSVLSWHLAVALIARAGGDSLRDLDTGWERRVRALADEAARLLEGRSRYLRC